MMDEPDDRYWTDDPLAEAGFIYPDDRDELKDLIRHLDIPDQPTKGLAAIVLIEQIVLGTPVEAGTEHAARVQWARVKLSRDVLA